ncbi:MAG: hypothetical protein DMG73_15260 [Acidobacteria bacterium]|nr:MAG: hypothetical protein DMG73_15260 [Acidobacteriota bacterium]
MLGLMPMTARKIILCLVLLSSGALASTSAPEATSQPDVFLITIDTLRADHVHCYGYDHVQTPALDGLARNGIRFSHAFTPSPITNTSHTTILTGLLPSVHGVTDFAIPLAPIHPTWAELLKKRGYHTAAFIGAVILDSRTLAPGLGRGFDFYEWSAAACTLSSMPRPGSLHIEPDRILSGSISTTRMIHTSLHRPIRNFTRTIFTTERSHTPIPRSPIL